MKDLLRFLTCGSVDDGKSTLIGRLLHDSGLIHDDTLAALTRDSRRHGTTGEAVDLALLVDGLEAERQQGITIDVAYRFFATPRRGFIVADTPGHEQYTRNMATGASGCDLAVILVDARKGMLAQTRRHACICSLLGIRAVVLAVNKMDLVGFDQAVFDAIAAEFRAFAATLSFRDITAIPLSARDGDNVTHASPQMPWYGGPTLLAHLETVEAGQDATTAPLRFPVQWVNRPDDSFRGFAGTLASGRLSPGDRVMVASSGRIATVARLVTADGDLPEAEAGDAITITLTEELDIARGDMLADPAHPPDMADQFAAHLLWMDEAPMLPGRLYALRAGNLWVQGSITSIRHRLDIETLQHQAARTLTLNEIGFCNFSTQARLPIDPYTDNRATGAFILVDRYSNRTVGAGMVAFPLRRAGNIHPETFLVDKQARAALNNQTPRALWFTGLSGSGKSTIAKLVEQRLHQAGHRTYSLDGDNLRQGLCRDLGFTAADRVENIRRVGEVAKLFVDAGLIVLCSFISPYRAERQLARDLLGPGEFLEIFVDTPLADCIRRDPKGLYAKAQAGEIRNFTGIDSPYEPPESPDLHLPTAGLSPEACAAAVLELLGVGAGGPG